jgi:flagellin
MAVTVNTNVFSLNAQKNISRTQGTLQTAMQRLSSGLRINQAKDDAAGLAVAMLQDGQARGLAVAQRTLGDGISALQVADNSLRTMDGIVQRMRELAVQYSSGTYSTDQKDMMTVEFTQLKGELTDLATRAKFNGLAVFGGLTSVAVQAGANAGDTLTIKVSDFSGFGASAATIASIDGLDTNLQSIATELANIGAYQSRAEKALDSAMSMEEAQRASYGRVMDADFARETMNMTSAQVIQQAGISALGQANTLPQLALGLLG